MQIEDNERYEAIKGFHIYNPAKVLLYWNELLNEDVVFVELHPSTACNHRCIWCRYWGMSKPQILPREKMFSIFDRFPKVKGIRISGGGEPLANPDLPDFLLECKKRNIKTGIDTNGGLLNDDNIEIIGKCCQYCRISLDAATRETYSVVHGKDDFNKVISNIRKLSKTELPELGVSYLVTHYNVLEIPKLIDLNLPITYIHFKPLIEGIDPEVKEIGLKKIQGLKEKVPYQVKWDRIIKDYFHNKNIPCRITKIIRVVGADGKDYVCCEHAYEPDFEYGVWDGSTDKCTQCRYNPLNEVIDMNVRNVFTKEFL